MTHVSQELEAVIGVRDAMSMLGVSRATVKRYALSGRLPSRRLSGGPRSAYLFDRADVEDLADSLGKRVTA